MGVTETEEALKAKVTGVCRAYCLQVWNKTLDQAGVEASSTLRREENVCYPSAIRVLSPPTSTNSKADHVSKKSNEAKDT